MPVTTAPPVSRIERVRVGDVRAMAALMRDIDDARPGVGAELAELATGVGGGARAFVVGFTGPPGAGKSTLVDGILERLRARGERVGVVLVDPSSPRAGGAILGDRVRMQRHATDPGVFIRSLASRGALGGLSRAVGGVVAVLGAGGFSTVLLETVGVGQSEMDVAQVADVTVLVTVPGLGDAIQTMKAGVIEVADLIALNKADRPGADEAMRDLESMLDLRRLTSGERSGATATPEARVLPVVALTGEGVDALVAALDGLRAASHPAP